MKYVSQLTKEQLKSVMEIYAPNHTDLSYQLHKQGVSVYLRDNEGFEDNYVLTDFYVKIIDWKGNEGDYLILFRKKMFAWFGEQYAIDYLLNNY